MPELRVAFPVLLWLTPLLFVVLWLLHETRQAEPVLRYSDTLLLRRLRPTWRVRLRRLPDILFLLGVISGWIALAELEVRSDEDSFKLFAQADVVFALDISNSMSAAMDNTGMSRLDAGRNLIADFVAQTQGINIGLVVFAEEAFAAAPPTQDKSTLLAILSSIQYAEDYGLSNRSAIGMGILYGTQMLRTSPRRERLVFLLTDGVSNTGAIDAFSAAEIANTFNIRVFPIGFGAFDASAGLDALSLQRIALITDGQYQTYTTASPQLALPSISTATDLLRVALPAVGTSWQPLQPIFLLLMLCCLSSGKLLRETIFQSIP